MFKTAIQKYKTDSEIFQIFEQIPVKRYPSQAYTSSGRIIYLREPPS